MPYCGNTRSCREIRINAMYVYKQKLIGKGVIDGSSKMLKLMCRKFH